MTDETTNGDSTRRTFLKRGALASTALGVGLSGCTGTDGDGETPTETDPSNGGTGDGGTGNETDEGGSQDGNRLFRRFVIRRVEGYEDDYVGRMLSFDAVTSADTSGVPLDGCEFADWPPDQFQTYDAQFLDERPTPPVSVDRTVYASGSEDVVEPATHFIITRIEQCPGEYVGVEAEWFVRNPSVDLSF